MGCICTKVTSSFGLLCVHVLVGGWETVTIEDIILINIFFFYFFINLRQKNCLTKMLFKFILKLRKWKGDYSNGYISHGGSKGLAKNGLHNT